MPPLTTTDPLLHWICLGFTLLALAAYELRLRWAERHNPEGVARSTHLRLRSEWVDALSQHRGSEIVAVQAIRNSLMSATINGSTAALALMGSVSLMAAGAPPHGRPSWQPGEPLQLLGAIELLLVTTLFAAFVCSAMAMRYYNHASYATSLPVGSAERERRLPLARYHLQRAGILYSWGLRCFLFVAPLVAGLIHPLLMPPAALALLLVLRAFDHAPVPEAPAGEP
jgi:hypothetical protein